MKLLENGALGLTMAEFKALPNYSCTLPTGTTLGKAWRRVVYYYHQKRTDQWMRGVYGKPYPEGHQYHGQVPM